MVVIAANIAIATISRQELEESLADERAKRFWAEVDEYDAQMTAAGQDLTPRLS
jgi:hypothetical protein